MFKIVSNKSRCFLRPWVFMAPLSWILRDRHRKAGARYLGGLMPNMVSKPHDLIQDHLPHLLHIINNFESKVKCLGTGGFVGSIVPNVKIAMLQGVLDRNPRRRIKGQHAVQQIKCVRIGLREEPLERDFGHVWQISDVFLSSRRSDSGESLLNGRSQIVQDLVQLVDVVAALEERPATQELCKNTSDGPDIN